MAKPSNYKMQLNASLVRDQGCARKFSRLRCTIRCGSPHCHSMRRQATQIWLYYIVVAISLWSPPKFATLCCARLCSRSLPDARGIHSVYAAVKALSASEFIASAPPKDTDSWSVLAFSSASDKAFVILGHQDAQSAGRFLLTVI